MTLPDERRYAIIRTREFLRDLLDPKKTPRVPKKIRKEASNCLRHYPWDVHLDNIMIDIGKARFNDTLKSIIKDNENG